MKIEIGSKYIDKDIHSFDITKEINIMDNNGHDIFSIYMNEESRRLEITNGSSCKLGNDIYVGPMKVIPRSSNVIHIEMTKYDE